MFRLIQSCCLGMTYTKESAKLTTLTVPWQNQHLDQIKTVVGKPKIRHPTTPPAIITSNQKTSTPPPPPPPPTPLHQKILMFEWIQKFYKFVSMPNGYSDGIRIFTKILKPVFGHLNQEGYLPVIFVDMTPIYKGTPSKSA